MGRFGKYQFEVGILQDGPHKDPAPNLTSPGNPLGKPQLTTFAGGPRRKIGRKSHTTIAEVSKANRERLGFNYLIKPFEDQSSEIMRFAAEFIRLVAGRSKEKKRCENLLQAIVRNPILRGEYPTESPLTQKVKGFSRPMIDTAQLFRAIRARCTVKGGIRV